VIRGCSAHLFPCSWTCPVLYVQSVSKLVKAKEDSWNGTERKRNCIVHVVPWPKHRAVKAYKDRGSKDPRILDLGTIWRWVVSFTLWPLYHRCSLYTRVGAELFWTWWSPPGFSPPQSRSTHCIVQGRAERNFDPVVLIWDEVAGWFLGAGINSVAFVEQLTEKILLFS